MVDTIFEGIARLILHLVGREVVTRVVESRCEKLVDHAVKLLPKERRQEKLNEWMSEIEQNNSVGRYATSLFQALGWRLSAPYLRLVMLRYYDPLVSNPNPILAYIHHVQAALATRMLERFFVDILWRIIVRLPEGEQRRTCLAVFVRSSALMMHYKYLHHPEHYNRWLGNFIETQLETEDYTVRTAARNLLQSKESVCEQPNTLIFLWAAWHTQYVPGFLPLWTFKWAKDCYFNKRFQAVTPPGKITPWKAWVYIMNSYGELDPVSLSNQLRKM